MNEFRDPRNDPRHSLRPAPRRAIFPLRPSALELPVDPASYADEPTPIRTMALVATGAGTGVPTENPFYPDAERTVPDEALPAVPQPRLQSVPIKPSKGKKPKGGGGGRKRGPDGRFLADA